MAGSLGTVAYDIVAKDKTAEGLTSAGDRAAKVGKAVGVGMTAVGASLTLLTDKAKKMQAPIRMTALQLGATTEEIRDLALETTNVTFPLEEVTASFDLLTRAGMDDKDAIAATATAFDTLGDATGKTASQITTMMVPAFNAFNIPLENAALHTDTLTHLMRNTTIEMSDFSGGLNYLAADIGALGLTMTQYVAILEAMADKGIQGSAATREMRTAVSGAEGDLNILYATLGLTAEEVATYSKEVEDATGLTQSMADAANTQYGTVDKLRQKVSELTLKYGALLEPLDTLGPVLMGLGPMILTYTMLQASAAAANTTLTASIWKSTVALLASPFTWVVLAVAGLIIVLVVLEKKFGLLTKASDILSGGIHRLASWVTDKLAPGIEFVHKIVARFGDKLLFLLGPIGAVIWALKKLHGWLKKDKEEMDETAQASEDFAEKMEELNKKTEKSSKEMGEAAKMLHELTTAFDDTGAEEAAMDMGEFTDTMKKAYPEIEEYENLLNEAEQATEDLAIAQEKIGESKTEVDKLTEAYTDLEYIMNILIDEEEDREDLGFRIKDSMYAQEDAQERYNDAIREFGAGSKEAERAQHNLAKAIDRREDAEKELMGFDKMITAADNEKTRILGENQVDDLEGLKMLLDTKKSEYETYATEVMELQQLLANNEAAIAEARTTKGIEEWDKMKEYIEANPVQARVTIDYLEVHPIETTTPKIMSAQYGGTIPGPIGSPVPIIAHGGEEFLGVGGSPAGGDTFNFGPVTISSGYDVKHMWTKIQELQQAKRMQRGMAVM